MSLMYFNKNIYTSNIQDQTVIYTDDLWDEISFEIKREIYSHSILLRTHIIIFPRQYDIKRPKNLKRVPGLCNFNISKLWTPLLD